MKTSLNKIIEINASGMVLMACNTHEIWDPREIDTHKIWVMERIIDQMERDHVGVEALSTILDEQIELLNQKLESGIEPPQVSESTEEVEYTRSTKQVEEPKDTDLYTSKKQQKEEPHASEQKQKKEEPSKPKKDKHFDMPTKLAHERKPIKKLILEDCVQLGLISKKRAEYVVTQMAGKQPTEAEQEVVVELRENLHKQVRKLIRKDKDNPWSSPKAQEDLRLEITQTPTVRSVLFLTKDILREREEWLKRSHNSITGRIFGSKMALDKNK